MSAHDRDRLRAALERALLYLVCDARPNGRDPESVLAPALSAGVGVIQLRDKDVDEADLVEASGPFRRLADLHGVPFLLNDRPDLVAACAADGVHVGQADAPVAEARAAAGPGSLVGLSTHSPDQLVAACEATGASRPDYVSVGPVWATPTKPGRPAAGIEYVRHAAAHSTLPWFAIGGIEPGNVVDVIAAGARRAVVVRAIRDAADPAAAARALLDALEAVAAEHPPDPGPGGTSAGRTRRPAEPADPRGG
jgi:thiamine-phosphate pyrophosphorylase